MIGRLLLQMVRAQFGWARPLGDFNVRWLTAFFRPIRPVRDLLNGKWLGHSVHAALTDAPIGAFTLVIVFDVLDLRLAADISLCLGVLAMVGAALAGAADYSATDDDARSVATVHATLMVVALVVYLLSLWLRWAGPAGADRLLPFVLSVLGYLFLVAAAWVGGEVVYALGNMVHRHAWRFAGKPVWVKLDVADIPEGRPTPAKAAGQSLVIVREGEKMYALHAICAHAGGPLPSGRLVDGCIECPWHFSRFDLATGRRRAGPTTFDQPRYELRPADGGGWEVRRVP
jgi:nitrite reductase/ring-hydroxylating ferredoxin subunit